MAIPLPPDSQDSQALNAWNQELYRAIIEGNLGQQAAAVVQATSQATASGGGGITIFSTNENHTFTASSTGEVSDAERDEYRTDVIVFDGTTQSTFNPSLDALTNGQYYIGPNSTFSYRPDVNPIALSNPTTASVPPLIAGDNLNVARLEVSSVPTATSSTIATIPVTVRRNNQNLNFTLTISFSKAEGGSSESLNMVATRQYFLFANPTATLSTDADLDITASFDPGSAGGYTWTRSVDGAAEETITAVDSGNDSVVTVTAASFGASNNIVYRAAKGNLEDTITIAGLRNGAQGDEGDPAVNIDGRILMRPVDGMGNPTVPVSSTLIPEADRATTTVNPRDWDPATNGDSFRNNEGTEKVLVPIVYIGGVEQDNTAHLGYTYAWSKNGTALPASPTDATNVTGSRSNSWWLPVDAEDIADGGIDSFTVRITNIREGD